MVASYDMDVDMFVGNSDASKGGCVGLVDGQKTLVTCHRLFGNTVQDCQKFICSDEFWDRLTVATFVMKPVLTALCYCDDMKGGTLELLYSLLL